jgi:hypothetical protein
VNLVRVRSSPRVSRQSPPASRRTSISLRPAAAFDTRHVSDNPRDPVGPTRAEASVPSPFRRKPATRQSDPAWVLALRGVVANGRGGEAPAPRDGRPSRCLARGRGAWGPRQCACAGNRRAARSERLRFRANSSADRAK